MNTLFLRYSFAEMLIVDNGNVMLGHVFKKAFQYIPVYARPRVMDLEPFLRRQSCNSLMGYIDSNQLLPDSLRIEINVFWLNFTTL